MTIYAYDIECFKNFFSATFVNVNDESDMQAFSIGLGINEKAELETFLDRRIGLVGYNNIYYDDPMLRFLIQQDNDEKLLPSLYKMSNILISNKSRNNDQVLSLRYPREYYPWKTIDLMAILGFNKLGVSLKQTAINLGWHKIQDLPLSPHEKVNHEDFEKILQYNLNDVLITKRLYEEIKPIRDLRNKLSRIYGIDLSSASNSKMANLILRDIFTRDLGIDWYTLKQMKTERHKILIEDCIAPFVEFETDELNELLDRISTIYLYKENNFRYSDEVFFGGCLFNLGTGGLHSSDKGGKFFTTEKVIIRDADVSSYYPNLIINNGFYPEHLGPDFIDIFRRLTEERLEAKRTGDKVKADGLKITINSIFGKTGYENSWLYDPKQFISTTVNGQLGLLMLIESFHLNGIRVISANTDGVVCEIPVELEDTYYLVAKHWEEKTGLELEFTDYKAYIRRDVNSYITQKKDGSTKEKGVFVRDVDLSKSHRMPIVPEAIYAYFIEDIPLIETFGNCKDILKFCISQKVGNNFQVELHTNKGVELQQKTNRFYISKNGGKIYKRDKTDPNRIIGLYVDNTVRILNDYDPSIPFESYNVDLSFYEKEALKIIHEIEPPQMSFNFLR